MGIAILGPLTVDGLTGALRHHDRVVLTVLAVRPGEPVSADRLADALWGDDPPDTWSKVVQGCVVRLRKVLGADAIETTPQGYRLALSPDEVDSHRFERLLGRGRELLALAEPERAAFVLSEAMQLWRGQALTELDGWAGGRVESARLDELKRDAEELEVDAALRAGRAQEVLGQAQRLVGEAPLRERRWALLALAQYQAGQQAQALRTLRQVRAVLANELGLDPGPELVALEQAILRQDQALVVEAALPEPSSMCPYRGLVPYGVTDADAFFGREDEVAECLRRLASTGVLAVVGPSGSGKSSFVRAGVAAALVREGRRVHVVTPGRHPLDVLEGLPGKGAAPVLVVDQCEEAVTQCESAEERSRFFDALAAYAEHFPLILTLRADHLGSTTDHPAFARVIERGLFLLGSMGPEQLRACIERPARQSGLLLEPGLVDLLLREVEDEPGALPLLSHALRETWSHREGRTLTVAGYRASGGIREAVARSAEEVYEGVPEDSRAIVRDLMLRLVTSTPDGGPVRSRVPRRLVTDDEQHAAVVERLVRARLLTSDDGVLVLAHEALVHAWPRFRQWLEDDTEGQRILRHLAVAADTWESMGRPDSELYRGVRLAQALDWRQQSGPDLTTVEDGFLEASRARVDAELREARRRAETERVARRRTRRLAVGLAAVLALALVAAGSATWFQQSASDRAEEAAAASTEADANRLAALSKSVGSLDLSMLLAAEAVRTADTPATRDGLLSSLLDHNRAEQVLRLANRPFSATLADRGRVLFLAMPSAVLAWRVGSATEPRVVLDWSRQLAMASSPVEDLLAIASYKDDETPRLGIFDSEGRRHLYLEGADELGGGYPRALAFSEDGRRVFLTVLDVSDSGVQETWVREYDRSTGRLVTTRMLLRMTEPPAWLAAAMSRNGRHAVSWVEGESAGQMLDTRTGRRVDVRVPDRPTEAVWFYPLASGTAQPWEDGSVVLYDGSGQVTQVLQAHQDVVYDVVESPDGSWTATADDSGVVVIWDVDPRTGIWSQRETLRGHSGRVVALSISPDGTRLTTASDDGTVVLWDMTDRAGLGSPVPGLGNRWMSNRPAVVEPGKLIVVPTRAAPGAREWWQQDRVSATFLDPRTAEVVDRVYVGDNMGFTFGSSASVSPDRSLVAVTYGYGTVVLDARTREQVARIELPDVEAFGQRTPESVWCTAWSPDGSTLFIGAEGDEFDPDDGGIVVVDTDTWEVADERIAVRGGVQTMEVSPDGRLLAVGMTVPGVDDAPPGIVRLLDSDTLGEVHELRMGLDDFAYDVSFSPDGRRLAVGVDTGLVYTFDVASGEPLHEPARAHNSWVGQVEWLPDGRTVVSTGQDTRIVLYDAERGVVRAWMPASAQVGLAHTYLLEADEDGISALAGERPGRRYSLDVETWLDRACTVAGRDLTRGEWASYLPGRPYRRTCSDRT
ncbi:MAG TPA: BTAD domain-containing putative transcriptional regulator [Nocardioides sp.]|nr:BTAD domain-containing putative transcriptional regulator [Nocardioides sp.]